MPLVYLDTNIFILAFETNAETAAPARELFTLLRQNRGAAVTSELTLAELLAPVDRPQAIPWAQKKKLYRDLLVVDGYVELQPITQDVLFATADFRKDAILTGRKPKLPDSIHVATAILSQCRYLLSLDARMGPLPSEMSPLSTRATDLNILKQALNV